MKILSLAIAIAGYAAAQLPANCKIGDVIENVPLCWECEDTYYTSDDRTTCITCPTPGCKKCQDGGDGNPCFECMPTHFRHPFGEERVCVSCSTGGCVYCGEHATEADKEWCYECEDGQPEDGYGNC